MSKRNGNHDEDVNIYDLYLQDTSKYAILDDVTTRKYIKQYREGSPRERKIAKERLVGGHQRFVRSVADNYTNGNNILDIISEGNIGLMKAIDEYDVNSGVKFTTYAMYWIRKMMMSYITIKEPMVTPNNAIKLATYLPKIRQEFWNKNYRQPTTEEIQEIFRERYNLNFTNKEDMMQSQSISINEKYDEDEDGQEFMESSAYTSRTAYCNTDSFAKDHDNKIVVKQILSTLNERDAYIVRCLYGIDCEPKSMDDIAEDVGISHERVRQIGLSTVKKLGETCSHMLGTF